MINSFSRDTFILEFNYLQKQVVSVFLIILSGFWVVPITIGLFLPKHGSLELEDILFYSISPIVYTFFIFVFKYIVSVWKFRITYDFTNHKILFRKSFKTVAIAQSNINWWGIREVKMTGYMTNPHRIKRIFECQLKSGTKFIYPLNPVSLWFTLGYTEKQLKEFPEKTYSIAPISLKTINLPQMDISSYLTLYGGSFLFL